MIFTIPLYILSILCHCALVDTPQQQAYLHTNYEEDTKHVPIQMIDSLIINVEMYGIDIKFSIYPSNYINSKLTTDASDVKETLPPHLCCKILKGLNRIYIDKSAKIIDSKEKADTCVEADFPTLMLDIYYGDQNLHDIQIIGEKQGCSKIHYSEEFKNMSDLILGITKEFIDRHKLLYQYLYKTNDN